MEKLFIKLKYAKHKGEEIVQVVFPYDASVISLLKQIPGRKYSQTLRSWYFYKSGIFFKYIF